MGGMRNTARFYPFHRYTYSTRSRRPLDVDQPPCVAPVRWQLRFRATCMLHGERGEPSDWSQAAGNPARAGRVARRVGSSQRISTRVCYSHGTTHPHGVPWPRATNPMVSHTPHTNCIWSCPAMPARAASHAVVAFPRPALAVPVAVRREPLRVDARVDVEAEHVHHVPVLRDHLGYDRRRVRPQRPRVGKDDDGRGWPPGLLLRFPEARKRAVFRIPPVRLPVRVRRI